MSILPDRFSEQEAVAAQACAEHSWQVNHPDGVNVLGIWVIPSPDCADATSRQIDSAVDLAIEISTFGLYPVELSR